jgi:hypothetical protein
MKKIIKKIILAILMLWLIFLLIYHVVVPTLDYWENKTIANFHNKTNKLKYTMSKEDAMKILGKPSKEYWMETKNSSESNEIKVKYKKILIFEYRIGIWKKKIAKIYFDNEMKLFHKEFIPFIPYEM